VDATPEFDHHLAAARLRNLGRLLPALLLVHAVTAVLELMVEASGLDVPLLRNLLLRLTVVPLLAWAWIRGRGEEAPPATLLAWMTLPAFAVGHGAIAAGVDTAVGFPLFAGSGWLVVVTSGFLPGRLRDGLGLGFAVASAYSVSFMLNTGPAAGAVALVPLGLVLLFSPVVSGYLAANLAANLEAAWHHEDIPADPSPLDATQMVDWIAGLVRDSDADPHAAPPISRNGDRVVPGPWAHGPRSPILVAAGDESALLRTADLLDALGFASVVVRTGSEAIEAILQQGFSAALLDVETPELDAFEAARLIRALGARGQMPLLATLPAGDLDRCQRELEACGVDGWVTTPLRQDKLRDALARWVGAPTNT